MEQFNEVSTMVSPTGQSRTEIPGGQATTTTEPLSGGAEPQTWKSNSAARELNHFTTPLDTSVQTAMRA